MIEFDIEKRFVGLVTEVKEIDESRVPEIFQTTFDHDLAGRAWHKTNNPTYGLLRDVLLTGELQLRFEPLARTVYFRGRRVPVVSWGEQSEQSQLASFSQIRQELRDEHDKSMTQYLIDQKSAIFQYQMEGEKLITQAKLAAPEKPKRTLSELMDQAAHHWQSVLESSPILDEQIVDEDLLVAA